MLNKIDADPRLIMITLSVSMMDLLDAIHPVTNPFLIRLSEDIIAENKSILIEELSKRIESVENKGNKIEVEKYSKLKTYVSSLERYTLEGLKNG